MHHRGVRPAHGEGRYRNDHGGKLAQPELQVALLRKLLSGEIRTRPRGNQTQHKRFSEELQAVLDRYHARQSTRPRSLPSS